MGTGWCVGGAGGKGMGARRAACGASVACPGTLGAGPLGAAGAEGAGDVALSCDVAVVAVEVAGAPGITVAAGSWASHGGGVA